MVFEFLRHAPAEHGLDAWLSRALRRPVSVKGLEVDDFWPSYDSIVKGHHWTEPELVFDADDGSPLLVVVEAKPGYGMHDPNQLTREAVDTANHERPERIAVIAIGLDVGLPVDAPGWSTAIRDGLDAHGLEAVASEFAYSPWAWLGDAIESCAKAEPALARYADDVLFQMRLNYLLGYKGAPMLDDLDGLTLNNAVVAYNRAITAAHQFFVTLHGQPRFASAGLGPWGGSFELRRDGTSRALAQSPDYFQISVMLSAYRQPGWPEDVGAFAAFYFGGEDPDPLLQVGAFERAPGTDIVAGYAWSEDADDLTSETLLGIDKQHCPYAAASATLEATYDELPWVAGDEEADVAWT